MVYYKTVKITLNLPRLAEVIIDVVLCHHGLLDWIVTNKGFFFISKFCLLLCYFLGIKQRLSIAFHPQTNGQTEQQYSIMEVYLQAFVNFEQNDWSRLLVIAKLAYNNPKNSSTSYTPFELNCGYYLCIFFEKNTDPHSQLKSADKLSAELRDLMTVYRENLHHAQELQKQAYDKGVKLSSYAPSNKVWLNSKYIKNKYNRKLEAKSFGPFRVLHPVGKQAYKLKLSKR